jgi:hypothetical protein
MLIQHRNHVLDTLQLLVNSCPPASTDEELPDLPAIKKFVKDRIITEVAELATFDIGQLHMVRSQFRLIFVAPDDITKITLVNNALSSARISPRLVEHDNLGIHFHYFPSFASLSDHLIADFSMALALLISAGEINRLRVCSVAECSRVFIDSSRNRSRTYCDSKTCGARVHAASYRQRQRS